MKNTKDSLRQSLSSCCSWEPFKQVEQSWLASATVLQSKVLYSALIHTHFAIKTLVLQSKHFLPFKHFLGGSKHFLAVQSPQQRPYWPNSHTFFAHLSRPWSIGWVALPFLVCSFVRRPAMVTSDQISTFFKIYRHKSVVLTQFHLRTSSTK